MNSPDMALGDVLAQLEPLLVAAGWEPLPNPRSVTAIEAKLTELLGAAPHHDVVAWCAFSERWEHNYRELWPRFEMIPWTDWFTQGTEHRGAYGRIIGECGLHGVYDAGDPNASTFDCLTFGHYGDGLLTTMSPVTAGFGPPKVFEMEPEGIGLFTSVIGESNPRTVTSEAKLPTLDEWVRTLVDAHLEGRLRFVPDPGWVNGPPVVRPPGTAEQQRSSTYFPWPSAIASQAQADASTGGPLAVQKREVVRSDPRRFDLLWRDEVGIVLTTDGSQVAMLDLMTGAELSSHHLGGMTAQSTKWCPTGNRYLIGGLLGDRLVHMTMDATDFVASHTVEAKTADWSRSGEWIVYECPDDPMGNIEVRDPNDSQIALKHHVDYRQSWWSPTDQHLVSRMGRDKLLVWDIARSTAILRLTYHHQWDSVLFSPDGSQLCVVGSAEPVLVSVAEAAVTSIGRPDAVPFVASWAPDSARLATATRIGQIDILSTDAEITATWGEPMPRRRDSNLHVVWNPTGTRIATNLHQNDLDWVIRDTESGEVVTRLQPAGELVPTIAWAPDGSRLLGGPFIFDAHSGAVTHRLEDFDGQGEWSPDGRVIVRRSRVDLATWDLG